MYFRRPEAHYCERGLRLLAFGFFLAGVWLSGRVVRYWFAEPIWLLNLLFSACITWLALLALYHAYLYIRGPLYATVAQRVVYGAAWILWALLVLTMPVASWPDASDSSWPLYYLFPLSFSASLYTCQEDVI